MLMDGHKTFSKEVTGKRETLKIWQRRVVEHRGRGRCRSTFLQGNFIESCDRGRIKYFVNFCV